MSVRRRPPYAAYLRVYEPLGAFPEPERSRLQERAGEPGVGERHRMLNAEHTDALHRVMRTPQLVAPRDESDEVYVLSTERGVLVCPRQDRLRSWMALDDFKGELPDHLLDHFVPAQLVGQADLEFALWREHNPDMVPRILTSTWHVPARWFVVFTAEEKELHLTAESRALVYRASMADARRRAARGLRIMRKAYEDGEIVSSLEELARWLEEFHPHSMVELDYGGLVDLLADQALHDDDSPRDVAFAIRALAEGDLDRATEAYRRLANRWESVQALEHAS